MSPTAEALFFCRFSDSGDLQGRITELFRSNYVGKAPAFQFYAADFLVGTAAMTLAEVGAYIRLLAWSWDNGPVPHDPERRARVMGTDLLDGQRVWAAIAHKFDENARGFSNARLESVRRKRKRFVKTQSVKAYRRWELARNSGNAGAAQRGNAEPMLSDLQSSSSSSDQEREQIAAAPLRPSALQELWNALATPPIPKCVELSDSRKRQAAARLRERSLEDWRDVITRIQASAFCRGENDRGWVASFDFLVRPDTAAKVLEGKYDNRKKPGASAKVGTPEYHAANDWWDECQELHGGACLGSSAHRTRVVLEQSRAKVAAS